MDSFTLWRVWAVASMFVAPVTLMAADEVAPSSSMSMQEAWTYGGGLMWVLAALSFLAVALVVYLLLTLREGQIVPRSLVRDVMENLSSDKLGDARRLCEDRPCAYSAVALSALDTLKQTPNCDSSALNETLVAEGTRQADAVQSTVQWLADLGGIAPMVGLLGTVLGMLTAFGSIATDIAAARPVVLAAGVSKAIVTTIFGLGIAIPCLLAHAWMRRRATRQIARLEAASAQLGALLSGKYCK